MIYDSMEYRRNAVLAKRMENADKTIAVLMDERPGFCAEAAHELICAMMDMGYLVHEVTAEEFCRKDITSLGAMVVLPHAQSVPAMCAQGLEKYWKQGGRVLVLGGPLFAHLIDREGDTFVDVPLGDQILDAAISGKMYPIVMEGFVPSYKVYHVRDAQYCMTESDQEIAHGKLTIAPNEPMICASARPHGLGYGMEHRNRFIPLAEAMGEGGRAEGRRGAMAYIMLSDVRMKRLGVDGNRFGYVIGTTRGACAAGIGLTRQDILNVDGMRDFLEELLEAMFRGVYLYEAGSEKFVGKKGEHVRLGAKIMNQQPQYVHAAVEFRARREGKEVFFNRQEFLALPGDMTDITADYTPETYGEYEIETALYADGRKIDSTIHAMNVPAPRKASPDEFVRVENGEFMLHGKPWFAYGINYWPHYYPGLEMDDYWMGWLEKANYDPLEVERDMVMMEEMGLNCLFTRVDGNVMGRSIDTLKDFMLRCERHNMKVSLSYCNVASPLYYQPEAYRLFMEKADLLGNPVMFTHDIAWEVGSKFYHPQFMCTWNKDWASWIVERYGSLENAEADWGMPVDRGEDGSIVAPPMEQFNTEGAWRVKICAYRRFIDDFASRKWNNAVTDIRRMDPDHLVAYRMGPIGLNSAALTGTNKHVDFTSPEGYSVTNDENGMCNAAAITLALEMTAPNKPVVWSEYGVSLTDVRWRKLVWDNVNSRPYAWKEEQQTEYLRRLYTVFKAANVRGSAPWWFPGGFRRVEMSDFGFVGPDGLLRPGAQSYVDLGEWFKSPRVEKAPDCWKTLDPDEYATGWGSLLRGLRKPSDADKPIDGNGQPMLGEVRGEASIAIHDAWAEGKSIAFRTPGTGTTTRNMPLLAVGNTPMNGKNPPKYLDAEFNWLEVSVDGAEPIRVENGGKVSGKNVRVRANVGNIQETKWLAEDVALKAVEAGNAAHIVEDAQYLADAQTDWLTLPAGRHTLRMEACDKWLFGEAWSIDVEEI